MALALQGAPDCLDPTTRVVGELEPLVFALSSRNAPGVSGELDFLDYGQNRFVGQPGSRDQLLDGSGAAIQEHRQAGQRRAIEREHCRSCVVHGRRAILKADDFCTDRFDQRFA
jgi:hypothetical protein